MKHILNFIWFFIGLIPALQWLVTGALWCITIVGIPIGIQCFKFVPLVLFPFGKKIIYNGGTLSLLLNILWLIFGGLELAVSYVVLGVVLCVLIITIPFGIQCFKFARFSLFPFGSTIIDEDKQARYS